MEAGQRGVSREDGGSRWKRDYCGGYQGREPHHPFFRIPATSQFHPQDLEGNNEARALSVPGSYLPAASVFQLLACGRSTKRGNVSTHGGQTWCCLCVTFTERRCL